ncbi:MAG: ABC transporter permease subunit [Anaerolineae bacterium]|nr:ABC transporter permease subunit [Anaerolineae bacterium]
MFITGLVFSFTITSGEDSLVSVFGFAGAMLMLFIPLLTTPLVVRESQQGTLELLMTAPVYVWEIVIGKFIAAFSFFVFMLSPTVVYLWFLSHFGQPDLPVILSGYLGMLFLGGLFISIGVLASALCSGQLMAAIVSITVITAFWLIGRFSFVFTGIVGAILLYLSPQPHFFDFIGGVVKLSNVMYFFSLIIGILLITSHILEMRLWR